MARLYLTPGRTLRSTFVIKCTCELYKKYSDMNHHTEFTTTALGYFLGPSRCVFAPSAHLHTKAVLYTHHGACPPLPWKPTEHDISISYSSRPRRTCWNIPDIFHIRQEVPRLMQLRQCVRHVLQSARMVRECRRNDQPFPPACSGKCNPTMM
jgi:hypothetical protein